MTAIEHIDNGERGLSVRDKLNAAIDSVNSTVSGLPLNFKTNFNAVGDGSTDNSDAWIAFGNYARTESAAGRDVVLYVPPGTYKYDGGLAWGALLGIHKLVIDAYGVTFQNTYDINVQPNNSGFSAPFMAGSAPDLFAGAGPFINSTTIGATTVTLKTAGLTSLFNVGDWVLISSIDLQYYGYPPNTDQFDFVKITAINGGTGVITFTPPLNYAHLDDFPDGSNNNPGGKARIWPLDGGAFSALNKWDIDHTYKGFTCNLAPNATTTYVSIAGRSIKLIDCTWPGVSPSVCRDFFMLRGALTSLSEPDKIVGNCTFDGVDAEPGGLIFQSSSIDRVTMRNGRGPIEVGAKNTLVQNWDASFFGIGTTNQFGFIQQLKVESSILREMSYFGEFQPAAQSGTAYLPIDGSEVSFANGKFSVLKGSASEFLWRGVPGMWFNLTGPNGIFTGDIGSGILVRMTEDSTHTYYWTTIQQATLPAWSNNHVMRIEHGDSRFENCSGCDVAIRLSNAGAVGKNWWNYFTTIFAARSNPLAFSGFLFASPTNQISPVGNITRLYANVLQPTTNTGKHLILTFGSAYVSNTMTSPLSYVMHIDMSVKGERDFTQDGLVGQVGTDDCLLNSVSQVTLPQNRWVSNIAAWTWEYSNGFDPRNYTPEQLPVIELICEIDTGMTKRAVPALFLNGGVTV